MCRRSVAYVALCVWLAVISVGGRESQRLSEAKKASIASAMIQRFGKIIVLRDAEQGQTETGGELYRDSGVLVIARDPCSDAGRDKSVTFVPDYTPKELGNMSCPDKKTFKKLEVTQNKPR